MPIAFDLHRYATDFNPIAGGPFVNIGDVMASFGDVVNEIIALLPRLAQILESVTPEQILKIVEVGLTQVLGVFFPGDGTTSPFVTAVIDAVQAAAAGGPGNLIPQLVIVAQWLLPQLPADIASALTGSTGILSGFATSSTLLQQLISAGGGTGSKLADFGGLFTALSSIAVTGITGLATGVETWLAGGGALPGSTLLGVGQLSGLATGLGSWLASGGALPAGISLGGSQLTGSVAAALISGVLNPANIPALAISAITGLGGYLANLTSAGVLSPSGIGAGALPSGVTAGIGQLTGLAAGLGAWLGSGGALPGATTLGAGQLTGLATGIASWLAAGGALPAATQLGAGQLTGLATGIASWLTGGGALPSAATLGAGQLTGLATGLGSWLTGGGALPAGITLPGSQLTGSVASSLLSGTIAAGLLPTITAAMTTGLAPIDTLVHAWGGTGSGFLPADLATFASAIPHDNLTGNLGGSNIANTIQLLLDNGIRAVQNNPALANQSIAQWNNSLAAAFGNLGYNPAGAPQPNSVADITSKSDATLKARAVSKKVSANIDQSLDASFDIMSAYAQATLPTITLTQGNPAAGYITTDHGGTKQTVEWEGYVSAGTLSGFYVNLYSVDTSGVWHFIVASANLKSLLATGSTPQRNFWSIPALNYISSVQGQNYIVELNVTGTGTYTLIGNTYNSNVKSHPTAVPAWHGATRTGSTAAPTVVSTHNVMQVGNGGSASITIDQGVSDNGALIVMWMWRTTNVGLGAPVLGGVTMTNIAQDNYFLQSGTQSFMLGFYYMKNPPAGAQTLSVAGATGGTNAGVLALQVANVGSISGVTQLNGTTANPSQSFPGGFANQLVIQGLSTTTTTYVTGVTGLNSAWSIYNTAAGYAMGLGAADGASAKTIGFTDVASNWGLQYITVGGLPNQPPPATVANPSAIGAAANPAVYSLKVPWVGLSGIAGATAYSPVTDPYATPGSGQSIQNPAVKYPWANNFDIVMCSDGSGGEGGGYPVGGVGGKAGTWTKQTLTRAQIGTSNLTLNIGGGSSGTGPGVGSSSAASGVSVVVPGWGTVSQTGAAGSGSGLSPSAYGVAGDSPGNFSYTDANGVTVPFTGGLGGSGGQAPGGQPGAGGSGGNATYLPNFNGGNGGAAEVWIRSYQ